MTTDGSPDQKWRSPGKVYLPPGRSDLDHIPHSKTKSAFDIQSLAHRVEAARASSTPPLNPRIVCVLFPGAQLGDYMLHPRNKHVFLPYGSLSYVDGYTYLIHVSRWVNLPTGSRKFLYSNPPGIIRTQQVQIRSCVQDGNDPLEQAKPPKDG